MIEDCSIFLIKTALDLYIFEAEFGEQKEASARRKRNRIKLDNGEWSYDAKEIMEMENGSGGHCKNASGGLVSKSSLSSPIIAFGERAAPSSSRGSGAGPSQPPLVAAAQPPQPPPPPPPAQPPLPPLSTRPVPRRGPIGRSGRRQYSVRIVKMELRTNIPRVGSSAENPAVLD
ncbi:unnamed protein product [Lactuca saligna]|uniref:Uncharacterized protein n=1 Tax=Lactuca saligna TaxID=75948 RepID=A0AA35V0Q1_LACSI|nr:unnamed protein product [Lactuca saligna]